MREEERRRVDKREKDGGHDEMLCRDNIQKIWRIWRRRIQCEQIQRYQWKKRKLGESSEDNTYKHIRGPSRTGTER